MAFTLLATACPAIQVPATVLNPDDTGSTMPATFTGLAGGESGPGSLSTPFNRNSKQSAANAEGGGGGYGIETGLELSTDASLSLPISAGRANIRGRVTFDDDFTQAVSDSIARVYVWLSSAGTVTPVNNSVTPPAGEQLFLGSVTTAGGEVTAVDFSGVMYLRGGNLYRQTADLGAPLDTPPAGITFLNQTLGGLYFWDGTAYWRVWERLSLQQETIGAAEKMSIPSGYQAQMFRRLTVRGRVQVRGHFRMRG